MLLWSIMFVFWSSVALCVQCRWIEATTTSTTEKGKGKCEQYAIQHNIIIIQSWSLGILRSLKRTQEVRRGIPKPHFLYVSFMHGCFSYAHQLWPLKVMDSFGPIRICSTPLIRTWIANQLAQKIYFLGFSRVVTRICSRPCSRCIFAEYDLALDKYEGYLASKFT